MPDTTDMPAFADYGGREFAGKWLVIGMAAFALTLVGLMYAYWHLHRGPFLELQQAIADAYPGSRPLVEGGQHRMSRGTPRVLRIVAEVEFDPTARENRATVDRMVDRFRDLAERHHGLDDYDRLEAHLFLQRRERELVEQTTTVDLATGERTYERREEFGRRKAESTDATDESGTVR